MPSIVPGPPPPVTSVAAALQLPLPLPPAGPPPASPVLLHSVADEPLPPLPPQPLGSSLLTLVVDAAQPDAAGAATSLAARNATPRLLRPPSPDPRRVRRDRSPMHERKRAGRKAGRHRQRSRSRSQRGVVGRGERSPGRLSAANCVAPSPPGALSTVTGLPSPGRTLAHVPVPVPLVAPAPDWPICSDWTHIESLFSAAGSRT